jgi:uncharacterized protein (TIGR03086 family)
VTATLNDIEAHRRAQDAFAAVLAKVKPDQLDDPTPCANWTVRDLIGHVLAGNERTAGSVPAAARDVDQMMTAHAASALAAQAVFEAPDGLSRTFDVPFGTIPGAVLITLRTVDALTHAWDLAMATAQPTDLDPELAEAMLAASRQLIRPDLRGAGRPFAGEQACDPGQPPAACLAAFLGRRVS